MPNLNKVMLMGNLTRDPELRYLPNNTPVANIGIAINRRWRTQDGQPGEETTYVDCEAFSRTAELINQYLHKGRPIFVEGRLKLDQWQDQQTGQNRSKMKVIVERFEFVDSRQDSEAGGGPGGGPGAGYRQNNRNPGPPNQAAGPGGNQPGNQGGGQQYDYDSNDNYSQSGNAPTGPSTGQHQPVGEDEIPF